MKERTAQRLKVLHSDLSLSPLMLQVTSPILESYRVPILQVWQASLRDWEGHLGRTRNRNGATVTDCTHYCLDTSQTMRAWLYGVLTTLSEANANHDWGNAVAKGREAVYAAMSASKARSHTVDGWKGQACVVPAVAEVRLQFMRRHNRQSTRGQGQHLPTTNRLQKLNILTSSI